MAQTVSAADLPGPLSPRSLRRKGSSAAGAASIVCCALSACGGAGRQDAVALAPPSAPSRPSSLVSATATSDRSVMDFGQSAGVADVHAVTAAVKAFNQASVHRDGAALCRQVAAVVRVQVLAIGASTSKAAQHCPILIRRLLLEPSSQSARSLLAMRVTAVRVEGDRGFALLRQPGVGSGFLPIARERGAWRPAALAASMSIGARR